MGKVVATIEARMNSTRLPGKVLKPICGKPMLELMVERVRRSTSIDEIVIATAANASCDSIAKMAANMGIHCFRGSEDDVLERVLKAAGSVDADIIVELTGDCPLIDPAVIDEIVHQYHEKGVDYCANVLERSYPAGMDTQVFSRKVLEKTARLTSDPNDREHVSLFIYNNPGIFTLHNVKSELPAYMSEWRLVVDTAADFQLVSTIFEVLYPVNPEFSLADIRAFLDNHPKLVAIKQPAS